MSKNLVKIFKITSRKGKNDCDVKTIQLAGLLVDISEGEEIITPCKMYTFSMVGNTVNAAGEPIPNHSMFDTITEGKKYHGSVTEFVTTPYSFVNGFGQEFTNVKTLTVVAFGDENPTVLADKKLLDLKASRMIVDNNNPHLSVPVFNASEIKSAAAEKADRKVKAAERLVQLQKAGSAPVAKA